MQFYEYLNAYQRVSLSCGKNEIKNHFGDRDKFYNSMINNTRTRMSQISYESSEKSKFERYYQQYVSENFHCKTKNPYFQIHPQVVEVFSNAKSENIPLNQIVFPNSSFVINLANDPLNDFVIGPNGQIVRSIFCSVFHKIMPDFYENRKSVGSVLLVIDVGEEDCLIVTMNFTDWDQTVESSLEGMDQGDAEGYNPVRCMRLAISVGFLLQSNNELVEPHVLSKDIGLYYSASEERRKQIEERAIRRRGAVGFRVGFPREHIFSIKSPPIQNREEYAASEKSLKLAHLRSGHWHLVRYGKNRSKSKVIWYFPTVVRPDLPFVSK